MAFRRGGYALTPPTWPIFSVAVVLAILSALLHYRMISLPALAPHTYEMALVSSVLLAAGALFRGI